MRNVYPFQVPASEQTIAQRGAAPYANFRVTTHDELNRAGRAGENQLVELAAQAANAVVPDAVRTDGFTPERAAVEFSLDE